MGPHRELFRNIVEDGVLTGYLLSFCEAHYCAENLEFLLAIKSFHTLFDAEQWEDWQALDETVDCDDSFTKATVAFDHFFDDSHGVQIEREVNRIWTSFLDPTSSTAEVCLPYEVIENTKRRIKFYKVYGPDVFAEATLEPTKAMVRDIMPRFVVSAQSKEMFLRQQQMNCLPRANMLCIPPPRLDAQPDLMERAGSLTPDNVQHYVATLDNYFTDSLCYEYFLRYLRDAVASENLLCVRAIELYEKYLEQDGLTSMVRDNIAWCVFLFFVCEGAAYEVSKNDNLLYVISRQMHQPSKGMFNDLIRPSQLALATHLEQFKKTPQYEDLVTLVLARSDAIRNHTYELPPEKAFNGLWNRSAIEKQGNQAASAVGFFTYFCWGANPDDAVPTSS